MTTQNILGFHLGFNPTGIGRYIERLDAADIQVVLKSADNYGPIYDLVELMRETGRPHIPIYRKSSAPDWDPDVPDYNRPPAEAAALHWNRHLAALPPELKNDPFARNVVWLELVNELDKNRADWVGNFCYHIADLALAGGFRVALPAWSTGEPEPEHWETPGMIRFLNLAGNYPDQVAVAVHEYSLTVDDLFDGVGYLVGRVGMLFGACDSFMIPRPTVLVTEFGWTLWENPAPDQAVDELRQALDMYYGQYPEVIALAIWYLGDGWNNIRNKYTAGLIDPVTDLVLNYESPPVEDPRPAETLANKLWRLGQEKTVLATWEGAAIHKVAAGHGYYPISAEHSTTHLADDPIPDSITYQRWKHLTAGNERTYWAMTGDWGNIRWVDGPSDPDPEPAPPPAPPPEPPTGDGNALFGLHAGADGGDLKEAEFAEFRNAQVHAIKVLSSTSEHSVRRLAAENPYAHFVVRAFLEFGSRTVTPGQFFDWTISDVRRSVLAIQSIDPARPIWVELHNEPNLIREGFGMAWYTPADFANWLGHPDWGLLRMYRQALAGVRFLYPGLSPGHMDPVVRPWTDRDFIQYSRTVIAQLDGIGVHAYWNSIDGFYTLDKALSEVAWYVSQFPGKPIWVTESSNNLFDDAQAKADQYVRFWRGLKYWPSVQGVTYFVASASDPEFQNETWVDKGLGARVANRS